MPNYVETSVTVSDGAPAPDHDPRSMGRPVVLRWNSEEDAHDDLPLPVGATNWKPSPFNWADDPALRTLSDGLLALPGVEALANVAAVTFTRERLIPRWAADEGRSMWSNEIILCCPGRDVDHEALGTAALELLMTYFGARSGVGSPDVVVERAARVFSVSTDIR